MGPARCHAPARVADGPTGPGKDAGRSDRRITLRPRPRRSQAARIAASILIRQVNTHWVGALLALRVARIAVHGRERAGDAEEPLRRLAVPASAVGPPRADLAF